MTIWKHLVWTPWAFTPLGWGKKCCFGTDFELWSNVSLQQTMISAIAKKLVNLQGLLHAPKFGELWSRSGWEWLASSCTPLNFRIGWSFSQCLTAWTLYNRQQANFGMRYELARAYSLEQQNAGWVHAGLCHASSSWSAVINTCTI